MSISCFSDSAVAGELTVCCPAKLPGISIEDGQPSKQITAPVRYGACSGHNAHRASCCLSVFLSLCG